MSPTETVTRPATNDVNRQPWRSLVIYDGQLRLGHERMPEDTDPWRLTPPIEADDLMSDAGTLLDYVGRLFRGEGTVIVTRAPGQWGTPDSPFAYTERELQMMCDDAAAAGWSTKLDQGRRSGWFLFRHKSPARADVYVGILPMIDLAEFPFQIVARGYHTDLRGFSAAHLAHQLAQFHAFTGAAWRANAGSSGVAAIRNYYATSNGRFHREQPLWQMTKIAQDWSTAAGELRWHRPLTAADLEHTHVHTYDMRGARLNAMGMVSCLGWGALDFIEAPRFDPNRGGYWRIVAADLTDSAISTADNPWWSGAAPPPFDPRDVDADGCVKLSTPILDHVIRRYGAEPTIVDGYLAERSGRYLRGPAERIRDALVMGLSSHDSEVYDAVKSMYQRTPSMMVHGGMITRHDWNDHILDYERMTVLTGVDRVHTRYGVYPVRVVVDELFYTSDSADPKTGPNGGTGGYGAVLGDGPQLGKWKPARTFTMAEYLAKYGTD